MTSTRSLLLSLVAMIALLAPACGPRSPVDGGWAGSMDCDEDNLDVEAIFDHETEDHEVTGWFYIEWNVPVLVANWRLTERAEIVDGEYDPNDSRLTGELTPTDTDDAATAPASRFDLELDLERMELKGDHDFVDGNGDTILACDLELDPHTVWDN
jgi:hypothetical protein